MSVSFFFCSFGPESGHTISADSGVFSPALSLNRALISFVGDTYITDYKCQVNRISLIKVTKSCCLDQSSTDTMYT